ncbi:MAG: DnaA/Hda family protein [Alphaproteobacteria bacterium]|jgi:chromosomal replication initiation ATPase DnaA|nr:DnaA/Hda family protein [Alphaproteobacteria bacterium]
MGNALEQIPLDLGHRTALGRNDFLVAPNNHDAVAWIDLWPEWPAPCLILYGGIACGKTHLGAVWAERSGAICVKASSINEDMIRDIADMKHHVIIEDADSLIGNIVGEKGLFHLYNIFKEEGRSILLTLQEPPVRRAFALPDLASRLRAAPSVAIREPDEQLLAALLVKLFNDRQIRMSAEVLNYILPRIERSFEAVRDLVEQADKKAMIEKRNISIPLIREILNQE